MWKLTQDCWTHKPSERPNALEVANSLKVIVDAEDSSNVPDEFVPRKQNPPPAAAKDDKNGSAVQDAEHTKPGTPSLPPAPPADIVTTALDEAGTAPVIRTDRLPAELVEPQRHEEQAPVSTNAGAKATSQTTLSNDGAQVKQEDSPRTPPGAEREAIIDKPAVAPTLVREKPHPAPVKAEDDEVKSGGVCGCQCIIA